MDEAGAGVWEAGDEGAVIQDLELHGENVAGLEVVGRAIRGLGEEAAAVEVPEGRVSEDSDIRAADEGEDNMEQNWNVPEAARQLPREGFHNFFMDAVSRSLNRIYHNDHILERPRDRRRTVPARPHLSGIPGQAHQCTREGAAVLVPEGPGDRATGSGEGALALEPEDQPQAREEPTQESEALEGTSKYQCENAEEEAQDAERKEEEEEEFNKKEEGPQSDMDSAENSPGKSSLE
ncbi:cancer/testis antigen 47A-like [Saccopteryx bilineata]|uniref:cancer/testis antigen 47A-like n=1 Tax=Saccopteryx bilineata TaxID=59482 RepID=UPI00338E9594